MQEKLPVFILNELIILPGQDIKIDLSNNQSKSIIFEAINKHDNKILVIAPSECDDPAISDFPSIGVIATVKSKLALSNGNLRIVLHGEKRCHIDKYYQNKETNILKCSYNMPNIIMDDESKKEALLRKLNKLAQEYIDKDKSVTNSILTSIEKNEDLDQVTDIIASFLPLSYAQKLEYVWQTSSIKRAESLINRLQKEIDILNIDNEIDNKITLNLENSQREYILKEKLREINKELGNTREEEISELNKKLESLKINTLVKKKIASEINKYSFSSEFSPESAIIKNYIDTLLNLPWNKQSKQNNDLKDIEDKLNQSHYGLKEIKDRILEYTSLLERNPYLKAPIICLVGPPGVGKTSIAMSIASSLNRQFYKLSVGGLNDSTELIGSRRTYLGAVPGKIMQAIIKTGVNNPLILIDEVDKMVKDYKGDPASTMLEILDETQNKYFVDNYIEEAFDLSNVMFILTANDLENIPKTLFDRLEIIEINSYTIYDKMDIAKNYLLKNIYTNYNCDLRINKDTLELIVTKYTKEPGVRELKRVLEKLVRKIIVYEKDAKSITSTMVTKYLDCADEKYLPIIKDYGICNILAFNHFGGEVSHVEVSKVKGTGKIIVTGMAGDVLKESAMVVKSYLDANFSLDLNSYDLHIHFVNASQKKDGPSAGVSIACAMLSAVKMKLIANDIAFTGEMTLKGDILPIGGLKEKLIAASAMGIKTVYIPKGNEKDLELVPFNVIASIDVKFLSNFSEIYDLLFK